MGGGGGGGGGGIPFRLLKFITPGSIISPPVSKAGMRAVRVRSPDFVSSDYRLN